MANAGMCDIRDRGYDGAAISNEWPNATEDSRWITQMLEHVSEQEHVEALAAKLCFEIELLHVADQHSLAAGFGLQRGGRIALDADDGSSVAVAQRLGHVAGRTAELEDSRAWLDEIEYKAVRRAGTVVELLVLRFGAVVA